MSNSNVTIRIDDNLKKEADELFAELGITLSGGINLFLRQCLREGGLPFTPTTKPLLSKQTIVEYSSVPLPEEPDNA